jgi:hypothetical protein
MYEQKIGKVFKSKFVGPRSHEGWETLLRLHTHIHIQRLTRLCHHSDVCTNAPLLNMLINKLLA